MERINDRVQLTATKVGKLKKARADLGMSQAQVAAKAKVPRARVKRIESGELQTVDEGEYGRLLLALEIVKPRPRKSQLKHGARTRAKVRRALEREGLLDVTLGDLLR